MANQPTPRQEDARRRIHELLEELTEIIGPAYDGQADPDDLPSGKPALWEWVLVSCWLDEDRQDWVTITPGAGMLTHHVTGLLRDAERQHGDFNRVDG